MYRRISAISLTYAGVLAFNTLDIQSIGSGIGIYSGLLKVSILSQIIAIFILSISTLILLIWPNLELVKFTSYNKPKIQYNHIENETKSNEYSLIIFFNILGALFLISSLDLISMYLSIELQSFGLYILATLYKEKYSSTSAGLKYFLLGGLSSCIILLGCGIIYSYTGVTNLESIYAIISVYSLNNLSYGSIFDFMNLEIIQNMLALSKDSSTIAASTKVGQLVENYNMEIFRGISLGLILIFSGFLFKIAASPFHNWAPDVYDDSPTLVTTWLTIMPKISILILLLELMTYSSGWSMSTLNILANIISTTQENSAALHLDTVTLAGRFDVLNILTNLLIICSLISLIIGSIVGLSQIRIKRLLAYSTISHIGFLLLALSVFSKASVEAFIFYIIQYTITNLDIFAIVLAFSYIFKVKLLKSNEQDINNVNKAGKSNTLTINLLDIEYINNLKGFFYKNPLLSISFSICLFSFAGVPPLIGFFAKQQVLYCSSSAGFYFLSVIAILVSVISASYYLKIIKVLHTYPSLNNVLLEKLSMEANISSKKTSAIGDPESIILPANFGYAHTYVSSGASNYLSTVHSLIIGILTLSIMLFIFNPELILQSVAIIANLLFNV